MAPATLICARSAFDDDRTPAVCEADVDADNDAGGFAGVVGVEPVSEPLHDATPSDTRSFADLMK